MNPFPRIQKLGEKAYKDGKTKSDNPYQYHSLRNSGPMKAAAWSTGWNRARKEVEQSIREV